MLVIADTYQRPRETQKGQKMISKVVCHRVKKYRYHWVEKQPCGQLIGVAVIVGEDIASFEEDIASSRRLSVN